MRRTEVLQEIRKMRFEEAYEGWNAGRLTQAEAAAILGMCERSFRRYQARFEADGLEGLIDRRLEQMSNRRAPVDEVVALTDRYRTRHRGWNVRHFHDWYRRDGGKRSYSWVKKHLQAAGLVEKSKQKGTHRKKRERMPLPGMMIHQDGSRHEWVTGQMWDLIVTMDDATNEHYDMRFVEEEGTASSFLGLREVVRTQGLPCTFYSDRGSHYWTTPEAGGKVDKENPTQLGRALRQLGIEMIPAYSPEARGRSERAFATHQDRLTKELALAAITQHREGTRSVRGGYPDRRPRARAGSTRPRRSVHRGRCGALRLQPALVHCPAGSGTQPGFPVEGAGRICPAAVSPGLQPVFRRAQADHRRRGTSKNPRGRAMAVGGDCPGVSGRRLAVADRCPRRALAVLRALGFRCSDCRWDVAPVGEGVIVRAVATRPAAARKVGAGGTVPA